VAKRKRRMLRDRVDSRDPNLAQFQPPFPRHVAPLSLSLFPSLSLVREAPSVFGGPTHAFLSTVSPERCHSAPRWLKILRAFRRSLSPRDDATDSILQPASSRFADRHAIRLGIACSNRRAAIAEEISESDFPIRSGRQPNRPYPANRGRFTIAPAVDESARIKRNYAARR